jgi:hypothetical protein
MKAAQEAIERPAGGAADFKTFKAEFKAQLLELKAAQGARGSAGAATTAGPVGALRSMHQLLSSHGAPRSRSDS